MAKRNEGLTERELRLLDEADSAQAWELDGLPLFDGDVLKARLFLDGRYDVEPATPAEDPRPWWRPW